MSLYNNPKPHLDKGVENMVKNYVNSGLTRMGILQQSDDTMQVIKKDRNRKAPKRNITGGNAASSSSFELIMDYNTAT